MKKLFWVSLGCAVAGWATAQVLQSETFESGFTLGDLDGQNGWFVLPGDALPSVSTGMGTISSVMARSGTRSVRLDSSLLFSGESLFAFKPLAAPVLAGTSSIVFSEFWLRYTSVSGTNAGGASYDSGGNFLAGLLIDSQDGKTYPTWLAGASTISAVSSAQWVRLTAVHNMLTSQVRGYVNGNLVSSTTGTFVAANFSDFDMFADGEGTNQVYFDDVKIEKFAFGAIRGTVTLQDYQAPSTGVPVRIRLLNATTNAVVQTFNTTLNANGEFTVNTSNRGTFKLEIKPWHWVSKTLTGITVIDEGVYFLTSTHANGDPDNSDEVDAADIDLVIANFGQLGDPNSIAADVNGSGEVDAADIDVVIVNFGEIGG